MAAGSIVIDLLMRTGAFETDTKRAEKALKKFESEAKKVGAAVGIALVAATTAAAALVKSQIDVADAANKAAQSAGVSTEAYTALAYAANLSDIEQETLAKSLTKVNVLIAENDKLLKALGVSTKDAAGNTRTADAVFEDIAERFSVMKDGAEKSALAAQLFGERFGPKLLPLLNQGKAGIDALKKEAEALGLVISTQTGQAAEEFNDNLTRLSNVVRGVAARVAADLLPNLEALTARMFDSAKESGMLDQVARALANTIRALASVALGAAAVFKTVGQIWGGVFAVIGTAMRGDFTGAFNLAKEVAADAAANISGAARALGDVWEENAPRVGNAITRSVSAPVIAAKEKVKKAVDEIGNAFKALSRDIANVGKSDIEIRLGDFKALGASASQIEAFAAKLETLKGLQLQEEIAKVITELEREGAAFGNSAEQIKLQELALMGASAAQIEYATGVVKANEALKENADLMTRGKQVTESMRTPLEDLLAGYEELNTLLAANAINQQTYARAVQDAQDKFAKATEPAKKAATELDEFAKNAAENLQRSFGDVLVEAMNGNFKNIGDGFKKMIDRMVAEAIAAKIVSSLFGASGSGGGMFGDVLGTIGSAIGFGGARATGGDVMPGRSYLVGEQGPEMFVPRTAGAVLPNSVVSGSGGRSMTVNQNFHFPGQVDRRTVGQVYSQAARGLSDASSRHN
jgi:hypothetical protein